MRQANRPGAGPSEPPSLPFLSLPSIIQKP
jgi:hypothetical protein